MNKRNGFILYIIVAAIMGLAILAFALTTFKSGAVVQLARNIDQNRLIQIAKSANTEVLAILRTQANNSKSQNIFKAFRSIFPNQNGSSSSLYQTIPLLSNYVPEETKEIADKSGYKIIIESRASLTNYQKSVYQSTSAYNAYIDIYSKTYREGSPENGIEVHERHDVRLVDLRHNLDKYALFVKDYTPDMNNSQRRVIIQGIEPTDGRITRVYLGSELYPQNTEGVDKDWNKNILWFDLYFDEINNMPGFKSIFKYQNLKSFPGNPSTKFLFYTNIVKFSELKLPKNLFYHVTAVKKVYEDFVNDAANGCAKNPNLPHQVGAALKSKCQAAMPNTNNNSAAYRICADYVKNFKRCVYDGREVDDYSACETFNTILETCMNKWEYHYGYLDANGVWEVDQNEFPNMAKPQSWVTALAYKGLTDKNDDNDKMGPYVYWYFKQKNGISYNLERYRVGKMFRLYGENNTTPVLVEGPVKLRFFKIGYFNDFEESLTFYNQPHKIHPEPVPILFRRPDSGNTFQNTKVSKDFSSSNFFTDNMLMSQAIDIPINALLLDANGNGPNYIDGNGQRKNLTKKEVFSNEFVYPVQKVNNNKKTEGKFFGRRVDFDNSSYNYPSPKEFLDDRVREINGRKTLCVDGIMYIEKGDMDLTDINFFYGKGLIYLATGNITFGNFNRIRDVSEGDSVRFYLRQGDFILGSGDQEITIEASLAALFNKVGDPDPRNQGSLVLNGKKNVHIIGNLIVDYFYTQDPSGRGLDKGGTILIEHDPLIMEPNLRTSDGKEFDPFHVSIGKVKTVFAIKSGEISE
ncbi:MAG: hypothetical protein II567_09390 [Candidatus Riflebacteria bacterium]|nr:hypothetical protein [Candidatus Riflebacteria bacterium]